MAARKSDPVGGVEKQGKIEIAYVRLEGNDITLQEAVRAFTTLINRPTIGTPAGAKRVNTIAANNPATQAVNGHEAAPDEDAVFDTALSDVDEVESGTVPVPRAARKYPMPTAIAIETEADVSLSDFVGRYKLEADQDRYVALAGWLWNHREQAALKAGLVLTLYNRMGWKLLADVTMPMRRLSSKKFQLLERTGRGDYRITQMGENRLAKLKT